MPAAQPGALTADAVADAVYRAVRRCATHLRPDVLAAMQAARKDETQPRAQSVLDCLLENARIGQEDGVPICQDTGTCWVRLEVGEELLIPGNILSGVNDAVARAYTDGRLRMSVVADALLDRTNTGDNTPAFAEIALRPGRGATLHVLLKGGGSDNASRVVMLAPGAGWEGVKKVVLDCVREKAANACPPLIVGVGVGATFDKVAGLAKHALLREVGARRKPAGRRARGRAAFRHQRHGHRPGGPRRRRDRPCRAPGNRAVPYRRAARGGEHGLLSHAQRIHRADRLG